MATRNAPVTAQNQVKGFASGNIMFGKFRRLFFIGVGGAGMSGIAEILHNLGYQVSGSDSTPSEVTEYLRSIGVKVYDGHRGSNVEQVDVVVISSAIHEDNPEVIEARRRAIPIIKRAEMLGELMRLKFSIGVAGTHGKTTTTSMIGRVFRQANLQPTLIVGGIVAELGTGATLGSGEYLIAEADEYDRSFLAMYPTMAVVLNVEPDHLDCYADITDLKNAFLTYINRVPFYGSAVVSADDPNIEELRPRFNRPHVTFGFSPNADYRATNITMEAGRTTCSVYRRTELLGELILRVPGRHNIANALAATAAATELDISFATIADALRGFTGVGRRFEFIGDAQGITVIDDYAHHPTEISATLRTAKDVYKKRVIAVFQPHLFSRTRDFLVDFAKSLSAADHVILTDIYPARELPIPGVTSESIMREAEKLGFKQFEYVGTKEHAIDAVAKVARPGDMVITIGAGSITHIKKQILERLQGK